MTACELKWAMELTMEPSPSSLYGTFNWLTEWAAVHTYGSFVFIQFLDMYFVDTSGKDVAKSLRYLWFCTFPFMVAWEFLEYFFFSIGLPWFEESLNKKGLDIIQDSIGLSIYILVKYIIGVVKWRHTTWLEKLWAIALRLLQFAAATLSCFFIIRNTCLPFNVGGFTYFLNTIPIGFYGFIAVMIILIFLDAKRSMYLFPEHEHYIKKMTILNYVYFLAIMLPNVLWSWSIYATTWVSAGIVAFFFYFKRHDISIHLEELFEKQKKEDVNEEDTIKYALIDV
jgi:hypothetical protein